MAQSSVHNYIDSLQRQIADTAARIKQKQPSRQTDNFLADEEPGRAYSQPIFTSHVEVQAYELVGAETAYTLLGHGVPADSAYAAGAYDYAGRSDKTTTVAEGLIFDNNRQFDFRV